MKEKHIINIEVEIKNNNDFNKINTLVREGWSIFYMKENKSNTNDWIFKISLSREL
jgi:hypothetical protein